MNKNIVKNALLNKNCSNCTYYQENTLINIVINKEIEKKYQCNAFGKYITDFSIVHTCKRYTRFK